MPVRKGQVEHIAHLSRLRLTPEEIDRFTIELSEIVDYFKQLKDVDTKDVSPYRPFQNGQNMFRNDIAKQSLPVNEVLKNAPKTDGQFFIVPKVLG
jgi:aspartyl-tRNA(Asn)/glutamyl-tRNA(Gln) amidotransferase subunit C